MKVIFCKSQLLGPISGADETLVNNATLLREAGHAVEVLLMYYPSTDDPYYRRLVEAGVPVNWLASSATRASLFTSRRLFQRVLRVAPSAQGFLRARAQRVVTSLAARQYESCRAHLAASRADLIHVITPDPGAMVFIRAGYDAGVPVIYQEVGTPYHPPDFESYYHEFTSVLPLCSEVAALSPALAEMCRQKLPRTNAVCVLPVMLEERANGHGQRARGDLEVVFGFAARVEKLKGPTVLMEAFGCAAREHPRVRLRVAGEGSQRREMKARAAALGVGDRYDYAGVYSRPEERAAFMRGLDVFVMPSFTEGTPNSIIEAMAHGLPVVASDVGGIPDVLDADSGILVPPGDAAALAEALLRLARDAGLRARMGKAARARYLRLFSPSAVLPVFLGTYRRVAGVGGAHAPAEADGNGHRHPWAAALERDDPEELLRVGA
jgi:glycosyltransferase involved in cell wall biosynthesis